MPRHEPPKKKIGLTSVEAAALIASDGKTKDPELAHIMASGQDLEIDALQRSGLRRAMGFDFKVKLAPNAIHVYSEEGPKVSARAKIKEGDVNEYGHIINKEVVERLVQACLVLKQKWDSKVAKAERAKARAA